jgi:LmbE family N-acetylglucosaminyl deacetylase
MASNIYDQAGGAESLPLPTPKSALTIGAHPDDAEFGAGGTLARWIAEGCRVTMLIVTDGSKGTWDPSLATDELITQRQAEQRLAADTLGGADVVMLDHADGELEHTPTLTEELCWWIRTVAPAVVLSHDPWKRYMLHPDHRAAGMAVIDAVVAARDHLFFPSQGLQKHRPDSVLLWSAETPDHFEDIANTFDQKMRSLLCHSTQGPTTMGDSTAQDADAFIDRMRIWSESQSTSGLPAEAFKRITP